MTKKPYVVRVSSQKGGVGKTTVAVNLACALSELGYSTLLVDADTANPSVGFQLGLEDVNIGFMEVVSKKVKPEKAIVKYTPTNLYVLPGAVHKANVFLTNAQARFKGRLLKKLNYDFIVVDTSPGFFQKEATPGFDEGLILSTPDMSSTTSAIRLAEIYGRAYVKHNLIINRVRNKSFEISVREIEEAYGNKAYGVIPEDDCVPESIALHIPAYIHKGHSKFSNNIRDMALFISSEGDRRPGYQSVKRNSGGIIAFLKRLFRLGG